MYSNNNKLNSKSQAMQYNDQIIANQTCIQYQMQQKATNV